VTMTNPNAAALADEQLIAIAFAINEELCDQLNAGVDETRELASRVVTSERVKAALRSYTAPPPAEGDVRDRTKRLDESIERIGAALDAAAVLAATYFLPDDASPVMTAAIDKRRALIETARFEFRTTVLHDLAALRSPPSSGGGIREAYLMREEAARVIDVHAQEMRNCDLTITADGLSAIAKVVRSLIPASPSPIQPEGKK
jgi:hypothetical protein